MAADARGFLSPECTLKPGRFEIVRVEVKPAAGIFLRYEVRLVTPLLGPGRYAENWRMHARHSEPYTAG